MDLEQVQTFVSITGASEDVARDRLQAHDGNLNAAINSFYNDGEPVNPVYRGDSDGPQWMEEDEHPVRQSSAPFPSYPPLQTPAWSGGLPASGGLGSAENQASDLPGGQTTPFVSRTRNSREVLVDWRDSSEPRVRSRATILESANAHLPSQSPTDFVSDEDEVSGPASAIYRAPHDSLPFERIRSGADYNFGNASSIAPFPAIAHNEGADIEEEMIRAAMEASKKETSGVPKFGEGQGGSYLDGPGGHSEDEDMAWALSQSLKTAEEEQEMRRRLVDIRLPEQGFHNHLSPPSGTVYDQLPRDGSASGKENISSGGDTGPTSNNSLPSGFAVSSTLVRNVISKNSVEEGNELEEEPLLRRRSSRRISTTNTPPSADNSSSSHGHQGDRIVDAYPSPATHANGHSRQNDEWGGLSSEEQDDAVMLEAALFGSLPENVAARFRYPLNAGRSVDDADLSDDGGLPNYPRSVQQPPSPTVIAQRLLREQQDDEYLASLEADREKEARAQQEEEMRRLKEEEAKVAALEQDRLRQEEEMRKNLAAEELQRQLAAKQAALPAEPSMDDEAAVTLMVRMPDGSRQGRRFRKSEHLQCLFDFIDVSGAVVPGSYRLVRQYPRKAFTDGEHNSSFQDLGLSSRNEVLFLELI